MIHCIPHMPDATRKMPARTTSVFANPLPSGPTGSCFPFSVRIGDSARPILLELISFSVEDLVGKGIAQEVDHGRLTLRKMPPRLRLIFWAHEPDVVQLVGFLPHDLPIMIGQGRRDSGFENPIHI